MHNGRKELRNSCQSKRYAQHLPGIDVPGYATIIVLILLLGSVQLFCIGIIGEYVGRTFEQSKDRPIYIAKEVLDYEQN